MVMVLAPQALPHHHFYTFHSLTYKNSYREMPDFTSHPNVTLTTIKTQSRQKPKGKLQIKIQITAIKRLCKEGNLKKALGCLDASDGEEKAANIEIYATLLDTCADMKALPEGKQVHAHILTSGIQQKPFIRTKLVNMYARCGCIEDARNVFDKMPQRNQLLWNAMIRGCVKNGRCEEAISLYHRMHWEGVQPDKYTFPCVLSACAYVSVLDKGIQIHDDIIRQGLESDLFVGNALVDMYAKCGYLEAARQAFDKMSLRDVVSWNALIGGYAQNGFAKETMEVFQKMQLDGLRVDPITLTCVLSACSHIAALQQGKEIHAHIIRMGYESDVFVGSALIDVYAKCGSTAIAGRLFDAMSERDVVLWNAMITGYAQNGDGGEALKTFREMQLACVKPSPVTISGVLPACAILGVQQQGKEIHTYAIKRGLEFNVNVGSALVDMYAKCGNIGFARKVFDRMFKTDTILWTSLISGYGMHGYGEDAVTLFHQMEQSKLKPDHVTFVALLAACSHSGLVSEGLQFFNYMTQNYEIEPNAEHHACIVDLLGRAGRLDEAYEFIKKMPLEPSSGVWGALLGACRVHRNVELAEHVAERLFEMEPGNSGFYVLLSNTYAAAGRWDGVEKVRAMMKDRGVKKTPGCSWIDVRNKIYAFMAGDKSHPQAEKIYATLERLIVRMKEAGYSPDTSFVLDDVEEDEKEPILRGHSEKLAIVFGLISTSPGTPIQITKNLRVCGDCHNAAKYISKIEEREINVRDVNRFHHFKDGRCSCGDYW